MANYYDKVLAGIGFLLLAGAVTAILTTPMVVSVFSLFAIALVGHALFVHPPVDVRDTETEVLNENLPVAVAD